MIEWKRMPTRGLLAFGALIALTTAGCANSMDGTSLDASTKGYNPPRVHRTDSLIDEPVVAHVDDDNADEGQDGAMTVPQLLGGVSAIRNTRTSGASQ